MSARRDAFTTLELLIVLAIVGVLIGVAIVTLGPYRQELALRNDARDVASLINTARYRARHDNLPVTVVISNDPAAVTVKRDATTLRAVELSGTTLTVTCRTTCPAGNAFTVAAPFGTSTTDFKIHLARGSRGIDAYVLGPSMNTKVKE